MKESHRQKLLAATAISGLVAAFLVLLIVVFHGGEKHRIAAESKAMFDAVIASKQALLSDWFLDEQHDVSLIVKDPSLVQLTKRFVDNQADELSIVEAFNQIKSEHDYAELVMLDVEGDYLTSTNPALTFNDSIDRDILTTALQTDSCFMSDIYRSSVDHRIYIDLVSAIRDASGRPVCGIIFKVHPEWSVDKMLSDWQMTSYKGKVSLIRKQADGTWLVYRPDSSYATNESCWLPLPAQYKNDPYNPDFRLVRVLDLPSVPWKLLVELDDSIRKRDLRTSVYLSGSVGIALVVVFFFGVLLFFYHKETGIAKQVRETSDELNLLKKQYQFSMDILGESVVIADSSGMIRYMNLSAELMGGWKLKDVVGQPLEKYLNLIQEETGMPLLSMKNWFSGENSYNQSIKAYLVSKTGSKQRVICSLAPLASEVSGQTGLVIVLVKDEKEQTS